MTDMALLADQALRSGSRRDLCRRLRAGQTNAVDVLADPPESLHALTLAQLAMMLPGNGPARMRKLGRDALNQGVNLLCPLGVAAADSRQWVADWLGQPTRRWPPRPASTAGSRVTVHVVTHGREVVQHIDRGDGRTLEVRLEAPAAMSLVDDLARAAEPLMDALEAA